MINEKLNEIKALVSMLKSTLETTIEDNKCRNLPVECIKNYEQGYRDCIRELKILLKADIQ